MWRGWGWDGGGDAEAVGVGMDGWQQCSWAGVGVRGRDRDVGNDAVAG
jgi:hypothetical protein